MVAKGLAGEHVGQVHLDHRGPAGPNRIVQSDRCMAIGSRVQNDPGAGAPGFLYPVDQDALMIALAEVHGDFEPLARGHAVAFDVSEALAAIDRRFALTKEVEVRPIEDKDRSRHEPTVSAAQTLPSRPSLGKRAVIGQQFPSESAPSLSRWPPGCSAPPGSSASARPRRPRRPLPPWPSRK